MSVLGEKTEYKDKYDSSLLVAINRDERRQGYQKMYGFDVWRCYEFSFLLPSGVPEYYVLEITNVSNSVNIFESKSLKLYLNSFNNTVFESIDKCLYAIRHDLFQLAGEYVKVEVVESFTDEKFYRNSIKLEGNLDDLVINEFNYNKDLLKGTDILIEEELHTDLLRSNCEITNQPDWGRLYISYKGKKLKRDDLLKYIVSYRKHQEFHEPTCERIYQDIYNLIKPDYLLVICQYTRRGGIDINPVRCNRPIPFLNLPKLKQQ